MVLSTHYRSPLSYSEEKMEEAKAKLDSLLSTAKKAEIAISLSDGEIPSADPSTSVLLDRLSDDLDTPNALSLLYEEQKKVNQAIRLASRDLGGLVESYRKFASSLALLSLKDSTFALSSDDKNLFMSYNEAKQAKDYARSDALRAELMARGLL